MNTHEYYMSIAFEEAKKAYDLLEVPIGGIIVYKNEIIAKNYNRKETTKDSTAHAEMLLIQDASKYLNSWRLNDCTMYITLEPCPMCAGAIIQSRISNLYFAAPNLIYGSMGTVVSLQNLFPDAKHLNIISGIMENEAKIMMKDFFRKKLTHDYIKKNT